MTFVAHAAGVPVEYEGQLRQRCSWCGSMLIDVDLARIAVPVGQEGPYPTWEVGGFVGTDAPDQAGGAHWSIDVTPNEDGSRRAPDEACLRMPLEVTS